MEVGITLNFEELELLKQLIENHISTLNDKHVWEYLVRDTSYRRSVNLSQKILEAKQEAK